jgi:hypothetical protein
MRVSIDRPDLLLLDHVPWGLALLASLFVLAFAGGGIAALGQGEIVTALMFILVGGGAGVAMLVLMVERCQLWLDRAAGQMTFRRRTLRGQTEVSYPLDQVDRALTERGGGRGRGTTRPVLRLVQGDRIALTETYHASAMADRTETRINDWLKAARGG